MTESVEGQEPTGDATAPKIDRGTIRRRTFLKGATGVGVVGLNTGLISSLAGAASSTIVNENALAGNDPDEWESYYDDNIEGFADGFTFLPGAQVKFKIKTASTNYRIRVYRLGWYGGKGARRVADLTPSVSLPQTQPAPRTDAVTGLTDCGNWATSATWTVPANAVSGVYYALFERLDVANQSNHCFFVVKSTAASDILVQTSDTTWQAYNRWGGASLYWGDAAHGNSRSYKLSYNRPLEKNELENDFFSTEYSLVRWLERNGYDVTYCSGLDATSSPSLLLNRKIFISSGHDEYWSGPQRTNVEAARAAGVNLIFFSGNEVFWKIRFEPSIDGTNTPNRTLVCYKETLDGAKIDPTSSWTGTWRDARFSPPSDGARPENALTGQLFRCINPINAPDFALQVPAEFAKMRLWKNTAVASLTTGQVRTLTGSTLGYEWDEDVDNGFRPAGLIKLSRTTATANEVLVDAGATYASMPVTHSLTLYKHSSGALVFGAGTVQWAYGLDDYHLSDNGVAADPVIQQATVNLLADMSAQPATLMAGLVPAAKSTDTLPPVVTIVAPAANASVPIGSPVTVSGTAVDAGGGQVAGIEVSSDNGVTWHPATGTASWSYVFTPTALGTVSIKVRGIDDSGNIGAGTTRTIVAAARTAPCSIFAATAIPQATSSGDSNPIEVGVRFRATSNGFITGLRFYKGAGNTGTHVGHLWSNAGGLLATGTFSNETASGWQTVTITPTPIVAGTTYVASVFLPTGNYAVNSGFFGTAYDLPPLRALANGEDGANGVFRYGSSGFPTDSYGNANYWVDVVYDTNNHSTPTVVSTLPSDTIESVAASSVVSATFSEPMQASSIVFQLTNPAGTQVAGTTAYNAATNTVTFTPTAALAALTKYTARVVSARDLDSGTSMAAAYAWTFTTIGAPGTTPASLWDSAATPSAFAADTAAVELGTRFTSDVDGTITSLRFYKAPGSPGPHIGHLWNDAGALIATATYTNESASGWQQVKLTAPVAVSKNRSYVVSYFCPAGVYAASGGFFGSAATVRAPLRAPVSGGAGAGNGVYSYGATALPTNAYNATNYWADVVLAAAADVAPPTLQSSDPAAGLVAVPTNAAVRATFTKNINPATLVYTLKTPGGVTVASTVTYDGGTFTATLVPTAPLAQGVTYTASIRATGANGVAMPSAASWTFTVVAAAGSTPATLFSGAAVPATLAAADNGSVELGVRIRPDRDGAITAIRFYKSATNTGAHVGHLWSAEGVLLGTASFNNETASGWQQANLSAPVTVTAGTTYVASYFAPVGNYSVTAAAFNAQVDNAPLHAPASVVGAGNGLYAYGTGGFPSNSYNASNYWVDVVFVDNAAPKVAATFPAAGATSIPTSVAVTAVFDEAVTAGSITFQLRDGGGALIAGTTSYDAGSRTATFVPTAPLSVGASYSASVSGAVDVQGNVMTSPKLWSFTTVGAGAISLWSNSVVPGTPMANDPSAVELGLKVRTDVNGTVLGVRFYKAPTNTGTHVGHLWSSTGQLLASVTFVNESASGWQYAAFSSPVSITAGTTYVVSYYAPNGNYAADSSYFATTGVDNGALHALANGVDGGNGVYAYGASAFPSNTYGSANYWVDLLFKSS